LVNGQEPKFDVQVRRDSRRYVAKGLFTKAPTHPYRIWRGLDGFDPADLLVEPTIL